jgi:hypothetical protein
LAALLRRAAAAGERARRILAAGSLAAQLVSGQVSGPDFG